MKNRRGVALLAALWLVVSIAVVALQFSLEARERRTIGILASERGQQRALAMGALAMVQAKLEYSLRVVPSGNNVARLRASDPWLDIDSTYTGTFYVDSIPVDVVARDLGSTLNINQLTENELRTFFSFVLQDYSKATSLAQSIMDWRDADSISRPQGAEQDEYEKAESLVLPSNAQFRDIEELQNVLGMTPEIYGTVLPYLTTHGGGTVNINTAPVPVLRALPGMTDATINLILQARAQGRRISNLNDVMPNRPTGRPIPGVLNAQQLQNALNGRVVYTTTEVELDIKARVGPQAQPTRLVVDLRRTGQQANIFFRQW
jgi:general secretion pathway protein K